MDICGRGKGFGEGGIEDKGEEVDLGDGEKTVAVVAVVELGDRFQDQEQGLRCTYMHGIVVFEDWEVSD